MKEKNKQKDTKRTAVTAAVVGCVCLLAAGSVLFAVLSGAFSQGSERRTTPAATTRATTEESAPATTQTTTEERTPATTDAPGSPTAAAAEMTLPGEEAHTYIPPAATRQHTEPVATAEAPQKTTRLP